MSNITLDEISEHLEDRKVQLNIKYYRSIMEIYTSAQRGEIIRPTSGGLLSGTPTSDFIDNLPNLNYYQDDPID